MLCIRKKLSAIIPFLLTVLLSGICCIVICVSIFPCKYKSAISEYCALYGVDQSTVYAIIKAESNFDKTAVSSASAKGLMQLTDDTFLFCIDKIGDDTISPDIFDVESNLRCGIWYLSFLLEKYDMSITNAVAAYNAGSANVDRWLLSEKYSSDGKNLDKIPFEETSLYVKKIKFYSEIYSAIYRFL